MSFVADSYTYLNYLIRTKHILNLNTFTDVQCIQKSSSGLAEEIREAQSSVPQLREMSLDLGDLIVL